LALDEMLNTEHFVAQGLGGPQDAFSSSNQLLQRESDIVVVSGTMADYQLRQVVHALEET
jgi:hypothetical protein